MREASWAPSISPAAGPFDPLTSLRFGKSTKEEEATETPPSAPTTDWAEQGPRRLSEQCACRRRPVDGVARKARHWVAYALSGRPGWFFIAGIGNMSPCSIDRVPPMILCRQRA